MYNLLEYSKNYRKITGTLWNYYRDKPNDFPANNYNANPVKISESFKYKTNIPEKTSNANEENSEDTEQGNTNTKSLTWTRCFIKIFKQFMENFRHFFD